MSLCSFTYIYLRSLTQKQEKMWENETNLETETKIASFWSRNCRRKQSDFILFYSFFLVQEIKRNMLWAQRWSKSSWGGMQKPLLDKNGKEEYDKKSYLLFIFLFFSKFPWAAFLYIEKQKRKIQWHKMIFEN